MKVCEVCGEEIVTPDGDNRCFACDDIAQAKSARKQRAKENRKAREHALESCGLRKVRGAMGGTYWE